MRLSPMNCTQAEILIQVGIDGYLSQAERQAFERHLAACADCRATWDTQCRLALMADRWAKPTAADDPGEAFNTVLMARIAARPVSSSRRMTDIWGWPLAAILCLGIAFALLPHISLPEFSVLELSARLLPHWLLLNVDALSNAVQSLTDMLTRPASAFTIPRYAWPALFLIIVLNSAFCVHARRGQPQRSLS